jgi:Spy/CpxP family protein refolding chaperone
MKRKLFVGMMGFLVIANVSALGTFIYNKTTIAGEVSSARMPTHEPDSTYNCSESECPMTTELGLTAQQMIEMRTQQTQINRNILGMSGEVAEIRTTLIEELMKPKPDVAKINQRLKVVDSLQSAIQHITIQNLLEVKNVLNKEQQEILFNQILRECKTGANLTSQYHNPSATHHERN